MTDLREIEDLLDLCLARTEGILTQSEWDDLRELRSAVRTRRGFVGEILAVAMAGATGSGKSSLVNAICGRPVAAVGVRRPTTSRSLAALPRVTSVDLSPFVDLLGVDDTVVVDGLDDVVVVDLPDMDSTARDHRVAVESALKVVDAVVWVLDPEKYADLVLHEEFLAPLCQYDDQFIFCLNKADRLGSDVDAVVASLRQHLVKDGYPKPEIVATSASPTSGSPIEIGDLTSALARRLDHKRTAQLKISMDVRRLTSHYWHKLDTDLSSLIGSERDAAALAMASFVSLGVAAFKLHHDLAEAVRG